MEPKQAFKTLLTVMVQAIVDRPELVEVTMEQGPQTTVYHVTAAKSDIGKVLGKEGSMVTCFRKILISFSAKHQFRAIIQVNDA